MGFLFGGGSSPPQPQPIPISNAPLMPPIPKAAQPVSPMESLAASQALKGRLSATSGNPTIRTSSQGAAPGPTAVGSLSGGGSVAPGGTMPSFESMKTSGLATLLGGTKAA